MAEDRLRQVENDVGVDQNNFIVVSSCRKAYYTYYIHTCILYTAAVANGHGDEQT